nr:MAG TPA: hypothetical protein [Caudoviricetes sp.]
MPYLKGFGVKKRFVYLTLTYTLYIFNDFFNTL